jgi:uncharacterized protein
MMNFDWDEAKRKTNLNKHGLDFADANLVFSGATLTFADDRFDYEEDRFITLGMVRGEVVVVAHMERDESVRIISMRKATKNEQKLYYRELTDRLGTD